MKISLIPLFFIPALSLSAGETTFDVSRTVFMESQDAPERSGQWTVYRDSSGRTSGTASVNGNQTVIRDSSGRIQGFVTQSGGRTVYRDSSGKTVMTGTRSGSRTVYRDSSGRIVGTRQ